MKPGLPPQLSSCRWYPASALRSKPPRRCGKTSVTQYFLPFDHNDSLFDFNHMAAGNDKSDELGVPYYQQHDL